MSHGARKKHTNSIEKRFKRMHHTVPEGDGIHDTKADNLFEQWVIYDNVLVVVVNCEIVLIYNLV